MKILFLDVDGVLNSEHSYVDPKSPYPIDAYQVLLVDRIVQATGCKIVLSSSWRYMANWREILKSAAPCLEIIDRTDSGRSMRPRGAEVADWMALHPEYKIYAILDDDSDFLEGQPLFRTDWKVGLTEEIANKVIEHLNS